MIREKQHSFAEALGMPALKLPLYSEEERKDGFIPCLGAYQENIVTNNNAPSN